MRKDMEGCIKMTYSSGEGEDIFNSSRPLHVNCKNEEL